jgi:hypothetical protein
MGRTDLRAALRDVRRRYGGEELRGVVLVTDGRDTQLPEPMPERQAALLPELTALGVPVFAFCTADGQALRDVGLASLRYSRIAFVRQQWELEARLVVLGINQGTLTVILREGENPISIQTVAIEPGRGTYTARFQFTPARTGEMPLTVEVQPLPGEAYTANNHAALVLSVIRDRIRVLQVAGRPSWDVRFLRQTLKQMPTVDLVSFFILRDIEDDPGGTTAFSYVNLIPFPTEELFTRELRTFDVVVFQNFDYFPFQPFRGAFLRHLEAIRRHVTDGGAGFVMIGGDASFDRAPYAGTAIEGVLPVLLRTDGGEVDLSMFRPVLTARGRRHPITMIEQDEEKNAELWAAMPELGGCHVLAGVAPRAGVLLEHPGIERGGRRAPIVAVADVGRGRSMAVATDEVWRWGFSAATRDTGNRLCLRFWSNALRWLVHELEGGRVDVMLDQRVCAPGERVHGTVRVLDRHYEPQAGAQVALKMLSVERREAPVLEQTLTADEQGRAEIVVSADRVGTYEVVAQAVESPAPSAEGEDAQAATGRTFLTVATPGGELQDLRPDEELLAWMAERSGGRSYNIAREAPPDKLPIESRPVERLLARRSAPLWNNWAVYGVVLGALCLEWWLRRRRGLA